MTDSTGTQEGYRHVRIQTVHPAGDCRKASQPLTSSERLLPGEEPTLDHPCSECLTALTWEVWS